MWISIYILFLGITMLKAGLLEKKHEWKQDSNQESLIYPNGNEIPLKGIIWERNMIKAFGRVTLQLCRSLKQGQPEGVARAAEKPPPLDLC